MAAIELDSVFCAAHTNIDNNILNRLILCPIN